MLDNDKLASDFALILSAQKLAHDGFTLIDLRRKYTDLPYETHTNGVADTVAGAGGSAAQVAAAHVHDTDEDVRDAEGNHIEPYTLAGIRRLLGDEVADMVDDLTNRFTAEAYPNMPRSERKAREVARLAGIRPKSQTIKYADIINNAGSISQLVTDKRGLKFAQLYKEEARAILRLMNQGDPTLYQRAIEAVWS